MKDLLFSFNSILYHGINYCKRFLFLQFGWSWCIPNPHVVYIVSDLRCNSRCTICYAWKTKTATLTLDIWKRCIDDIANHISPYTKVNISGGEVLLPGVSRELIFYAAAQLPYTGITTNGYCIDTKMASELIGKKFNNINVSLDGTTPDTVKKIRGIQKAYLQTTRAILMLLKERKKQKSPTKIIIKSVITGLNIHEIPKLVLWAKKIGVDGIYFQPVQPIFSSDQTIFELKQSPLWVSEKDRATASKYISTLIAMKRNGYPILNSEEELVNLRDYFGIVHSNNHSTFGKGCMIDMDSIFLSPNGDVHFCLDFPAIGNIKDQSLRAIIRSPKAYSQRRQIRLCQKNCTATCASRKSLKQFVTLFYHGVIQSK